MELKWLEDYLALVDSGNFTLAADVRNLSQPAFSRRIQALEAWLGVTLIDRSKKPFRFTAVAREHEATFRSLVNAIYQSKNRIKYSVRDQHTLSVATQHSLLVTPFLPRFLEKLSSSLVNLNYSIVSENMDTCVSMFLKGAIDMLVIYETEGNRNVITPHFSVRKLLSSDEMILVSTPQIHDAINKKVNCGALPLLIYPTSSFFGGVIWADVLPKVLRDINASIVCESSFSVGLREMALASTGAAWLPRSIVENEIQEKRLIVLDEISQPIPMNVVAHLSLISNNTAISELVETLSVAEN
jgi:DNA-binding transcriptional LysR family regulator